MAKRFLKYFFTGTAVLLLLCILLVVTFDPFYQYHKPLPGLNIPKRPESRVQVDELKVPEFLQRHK